MHPRHYCEKSRKLFPTSWLSRIFLQCAFLYTSWHWWIFSHCLTWADFCTTPGIGKFFPKAWLWRIAWLRRIFLTACLSRIFYKAFHKFIDSSESSVVRTTYTEPDRFKSTEVHMGFKSVTFFTSVRCVCRLWIYSCTLYRAHPLAPLWHFRRINTTSCTP